MRALYTAATGMMAQELNVQVISNNIANLRTTGYKRQQRHFQDLLYQHLRRAGVAASDQGTSCPPAIELGSGVKTVSTTRAMTQGNLTPTEKDYDVAIRGEGFFRIRMPDGRTAYTRDGSFDLDAQGQLVTARRLSRRSRHHRAAERQERHPIGAQGQVQATIPGQTTPQDLGQIQLARFVNKSGLESIGDNLFLETAASGPAIDGNPGAEGFGNLQQGYLEEANVNAVTEISSLIAAQRAYEMNAKVVTAADQMLLVHDPDDARLGERPMTLKIAVPPLSPMSVGRLRPMIVIRILLAAAALCLVLSPAFSAERLRLRGAVTVDADVLTLGGSDRRSVRRRRRRAAVPQPGTRRERHDPGAPHRRSRETVRARARPGRAGAGARHARRPPHRGGRDRNSAAARARAATRDRCGCAVDRP